MVPRSSTDSAASPDSSSLWAVGVCAISEDIGLNVFSTWPCSIAFDWVCWLVPRSSKQQNNSVMQINDHTFATRLDFGILLYIGLKYMMALKMPWDPMNVPPSTTITGCGVPSKSGINLTMVGNVQTTKKWATIQRALSLDFLRVRKFSSIYRFITKLDERVSSGFKFC